VTRDALTNSGVRIETDEPNLAYIEFRLLPEHAMNVFPADALHLWPRKNYYLFGLPNKDGSITINLYYPLKGPGSFEEIKSDNDFEQLFRE
jgi:hypothetical protein